MRYWILAAFLLMGAAPSPETIDPPEMVIVTFHPQSGKIDELEQLVWQQWETLLRLHLTANNEHHTYRGQSETGELVIIDTFTWKDHATPDHAPAEVVAIWRKMNKAVEKRAGQPAIDIVAVDERQPPQQSRDSQ